MSTSEALGKTETINGKRYYNVPGGLKYPSVTTIIGEFSDDTGLIEWRERVGDAEADRISELGRNRGTVMHQLYEYYLAAPHTKKSERLKYAQEKIIDFIKQEGFTEQEETIGRKLFFNSYNSGLFDRIKKVICLEDMLHCSLMGGYAGRVDTIYLNHKNQVIILDFKSSKKSKDKDWISDYYDQIAAYYLAYWEMTGEKPAGGEIWISNERDWEPQIFEVNGEDLLKHAKSFLKKVKMYHEKYPMVK